MKNEDATCLPDNRMALLEWGKACHLPSGQDWLHAHLSLLAYRQKIGKITPKGIDLLGKLSPLQQRTDLGLEEAREILIPVLEELDACRALYGDDLSSS